jgi:hypothetical protein
MPISILDQMRSGEIYAPAQNGKEAEYVIEKPQYSQGEDMTPVARQTGVLDYRNQQNFAQNVDRMAGIQQQTGAKVTGMENLQFDPAQAKKFQSLSEVDQMAAEMVANGTMKPSDFYKIAKQSEDRKKEAEYKYKEKIAPSTVINKVEGQGQGQGGGGQQGPDPKRFDRLVKFSENEKTRIAAVPEAKALMVPLVESFTTGKLNVPTEMIANAASKVPWIGKYVSEKNYDYNALAVVVSETWLRAATGAAAPPEEVRRYASFLPQPGESLETAQKHLDSFYNKLAAKASGGMAPRKIEADIYRKNGFVDEANAMDDQVNMVNDLIKTSWDAVPKIYQPVQQQAAPVAPVTQPAAPVAPVAQPAAAPVVTDPDKLGALDWISKNPNDPRVAQIKQRLGIK